MNEVPITASDGGEVIDLGPHSSGPAQHRHARHDEGFYVVYL
jgi:hypothetical protein